MSVLDLGKVKFLWRGTWVSGSSYLANDVVEYNGSIWICKSAQSVGTGSEFSPGLRDRNNANGTSLDPNKIITYDITVATVSSQSLFFINGHRSQQLTLLPNFTYRFYQNTSSNQGNRFALSSVIDGTNGGGTEYTTGVTYTGTPGTDGYVTIKLSSNAPTTLYYYSPSNSGVGGLSNGKIFRGSTWRGWQNWDQVSTGAKPKGVWASNTQYYYNDIISFEGATYIALADNINKNPSTLTTQHHWDLLSPGDRLSENASIAWPQNSGPIDWPYPHGRNDTPSIFNNAKWITRSGRLMNQGSGRQGNSGLGGPSVDYTFNSYPQEVCFHNYDWWNSRDNGGPGKLTTPDGQPPRVIQVEVGFGFTTCLFNNGEVWKWGYGTNGERGDGDTATYVGIPRRVVNLTDVRIIKISQAQFNNNDAHHTMALDEDGYVWVWGYNGYGQVGLGHTNNTSGAQRIPRSYFGGRRVIDILAGNCQYGQCYVRTSDDNLYAWGYNPTGQLGDGSAANKSRPVIMANWDPLANNGIVKWQYVGGSDTTGGAFMLLDGNGFVWHTGYNGTGVAANASTSNNLQLTKSTLSPAGSIVNFWVLANGSGSETNYYEMFMRTNTGATFVVGQGSSASYVTGRSTNSAAIITTPVAITDIVNLKDVRMQGGLGTNKYVVWLQDDGKCFYQGTNGGFNPYIGTSNNISEAGGSNYKPAYCFLPPGLKVVKLMPIGTTYDGNTRPSGMAFIMNNGMVMAGGYTNNSNAAEYEQGSFLSNNAVYNGRGAFYQQPVPIHFSR